MRTRAAARKPEVTLVPIPKRSERTMRRLAAAAPFFCQRTDFGRTFCWEKGLAQCGACTAMVERDEAERERWEIWP